MILAALDCDADSIEAWNRWYDIDHLPPNVALDGVMLGRRYAATPDLFAARLASDGSPWAGGRSAFLTTYVLTGDPAHAFQGMVDLRERLVGAGRMNFPDDKKAVRDGGFYRVTGAVGAPYTKADPEDVPFLGHTGIVLVVRTGGDAGYYADRAHALVGIDGVHGVWTLTSGVREGVDVDVVLVEGDAAELAEQARQEAPHQDGATILADAPYELIVPVRYPFADAIRGSVLPQRI